MVLNPNFNDSLFDQAKPLFTPETIINHVEELIKQAEPIPHAQILARLLDRVNTLDFRELAELEEAEKLNNSHLQIITVEQVLNLAKLNKWGICRNHDFIYLYNGAYWSLFDVEELKAFLGEAAEKMGVDKFKARYFQFRETLFKQFLTLANLPKPEQPKEVVLVNLKNGTFEISPTGHRLRPFDRSDFITYQLPFEYNPEAEAPLFTAYLNKVLPDQERQKVLAEYLGYVFIKNGTIKEEKVLFLYGTGANGKSVFHEVVKALLGAENTSQYSLQDLTNDNGYYRAMIANKLVNYASEISGKLEAATFKQLASGETVSARLPYGNPMQISDYARLIFNVNDLPRDVEQTDAFFRRFLIVPFDVTIPEAEQDKQLHIKIIENELSGVFNWVLQGLNRLLSQKQFTNCQAAHDAREHYKTQSDSVKMFIEENGYKNSPTEYRLIKELYQEYRNFCIDDGFKPVNKSNFIKRLQGFGVPIEKKNIGNVAFIAR
ncbi:DNA primase family protein [Adhaeribacter terreus]|uniref:Phage/plasmid primase, P4 family n=1 Tax=Adhaeribacter terreus TaxID=529703 RepID=A0ABW0E9X4_9BACT